MQRRTDLRTASADIPADIEQLKALILAREAEIIRIEASLANERRAALTIRKEMDELRAAYEELLSKQSQATWSARLRRLFGR